MHGQEPSIHPNRIVVHIANDATSAFIFNRCDCGCRSRIPATMCYISLELTTNSIAFRTTGLCQEKTKEDSLFAVSRYH